RAHDHARPRPPVGQRGPRLDAARALAAEEQPGDPAAGQAARPERQRARDVRAPRRALRARRAAEGAVVRAGAVALVTDVRDDPPALLLGPLAQEVVVAPDRPRVLVARRDEALDALEVALELAGALDLVLAAPALEDLL